MKKAVLFVLLFILLISTCVGCAGTGEKLAGSGESSLDLTPSSTLTPSPTDANRRTTVARLRLTRTGEVAIQETEAARTRAVHFLTATVLALTPSATPTPSSTPRPTRTPSYMTAVSQQKTATAVYVETARVSILQKTPQVTATSALDEYYKTQEAEWEEDPYPGITVNLNQTPEPTLDCSGEEDCYLKAHALEAEFYETFRNAVINYDCPAMAAMIHYPLITIIDGRYQSIDNQAEFIQYCDDIIDEKVINAVTNQHFDSSMEMGYKGWMVDYGTIWFTTYCHDSSCRNPFPLVTNINNDAQLDDAVLYQTPPAVTTDQFLFGEWRVVDTLSVTSYFFYYPYPDIEGYLGLKLWISPGKIQFAGQTCQYESLFHWVTDLYDYLYMWHGKSTGAWSLGILNQDYIGIVETDCGGIPFWNILIINQDKIYIPLGDPHGQHYLVLERIK